MTRALVTRPAEDSAPLADALGARGIEPLVDRVFDFEQLPQAKDYMESATQVGQIVVRMG